MQTNHCVIVVVRSSIVCIVCLGICSSYRSLCSVRQPSRQDDVDGPVRVPNVDEVNGLADLLRREHAVHYILRDRVERVLLGEIVDVGLQVLQSTPQSLLVVRRPFAR